MKGAVVFTIGIVLVFAMLFGCISYTSYVNRNKEHVYTAEEVFAMECAKRGGNPVTKVGKDWEGDKSVDINEFKCEGVADVRN